MKNKSQQILITLLSCFGLFFPLNHNYILAQTVERTNPLIGNFQDELIPNIKRELSELEIKRIREKIEELNTLAQADLTAENTEKAFESFYRAINLSRYLGVKAEIKMISQVGKTAWDKSLNQDINFLMERLAILELQNSNQGQIEPKLLPLFMEAYEILHNIDKSITLNTKKLENARKDNQIDLIKISLENLGRLYLAKFDYYRAEPIYQELLNISRLEQNYLAEGIYLQKLAEISGAIVQPENAVKYKEELFQSYLNSQNLTPLPMLKIAIGDDYKTLKNPDKATKSYQDAFKTAWAAQQYAVAGDALRKLGSLYQEYEQLDSALDIYKELIKVEQLSYNFYGLMTTYDSMGLIYKQKQDYSSALKSFEKALEISRNLKHREDYFLTQINELKHN